MSESDSATPMSGFRHFNLSEPILKALDDVGYETPTPIQQQIIPYILEGRDVLGQAQTGTGKTAAFALPILMRIDLKRLAPQVLVLTPTRELAIQVAEAFQRYAAHLPGFHVLPIYGGQNYNIQFKPLQRGVHVIVGTPGRVMDHLRRGTLKLETLSCLVLDEADEMLKMGFLEDVEWILEQTPPQRQIALFSATIPAEIRAIARKHLKNPKDVTMDLQTVSAATIRQRYWLVSEPHKLDALTRILEAEPTDGVLIFVRTKGETVSLSSKLEARGYSSTAINGDMIQRMREQVVEQFKSGKLDILVATGVAARGLDVERISHVINYDIPSDTEAYVHRIGRTGRAGRPGEAILFVSPRERRLLYSLEKVTSQRITLMELPSTETINDQRISRFKQKITDTLAVEDLGFFYQIIEQYQNEHNIPALEIAAALARLVQGDTPMLFNAPTPQIERFVEDRPSFSSRRGARGNQRDDRRDMNFGTAMQRYRIEVGLTHGVKTGNIVGAIANETGLSSQHIGRIAIYDEYSTVDLPEGLPKEFITLLKNVWVSGQKLKISRLDEPEARSKSSKDYPERRPAPSVPSAYKSKYSSDKPAKKRDKAPFTPKRHRKGKD